MSLAYAIICSNFFKTYNLHTTEKRNNQILQVIIKILEWLMILEVIYMIFFFKNLRFVTVEKKLFSPRTNYCI